MVSVFADPERLIELFEFSALRALGIPLGDEAYSLAAEGGEKISLT